MATGGTHLAQHREKPTEGSRFAAVDNPRITFQEPVHRGFIHFVQVKLPIAEPSAESSDRVHLHWNAPDNNNPGRYFGPSLLDRTHQLSIGGYVDVPAGFRIGLISHFYSPLTSSFDAANTGSAGEIFRTDFTGDGTIQDPLPGTKFGSFDRSVNAAGLTNLIDNYNSTQANQATPAGKVLIANNVMTLAQLQALGGVSPVICPPPPTSQSGCPNSPGSQVDFGWLRATDLKLAWRHTIKDRFTVEPSVGIYNLFNFANFNLPPTTMFGVLNGGGPNGGSSINGTTRSDEEQFRVGNGTGVYSLGSQRQIEFGLRLTF